MPTLASFLRECVLSPSTPAPEWNNKAARTKEKADSLGSLRMRPRGGYSLKAVSR